MTRDSWIDKHLATLTGLLLDGMCADREQRARVVLNLPGRVRGLLAAMHDELVPPPQLKEPPPRSPATNHRQGVRS